MRFFVVSPDGQRYGPADAKMLSQWVQEGRILPTHELEEEGTGRRMRADQVPGLFMGSKTAYQNPSMSGAYIPPSVSMSPILPDVGSENQVSKAWNNAYVGLALTVLGMFIPCCIPISLVGGVFGAIATNHAVSAKKQGSSNAQGAMVLGIVVLVLAILVLLGHLSIGSMFPRF